MLERILKKEIKNIEGDFLLSIEINKTSCNSINILTH